jgi:hypothetical protein
MIVAMWAFLGSLYIDYLNSFTGLIRSQKSMPQTSQNKPSDNSKVSEMNSVIEDEHNKSEPVVDTKPLDMSILSYIRSEVSQTIKMLYIIVQDGLLFNAAVFAMMWSISCGFLSFERFDTAAAVGIGADSFASVLGLGQLMQAVLQFALQMIGTRYLFGHIFMTSFEY